MMIELPTEREEFAPNCVYVILFRDYYRLRKCVCISDEEYRLKHAAIVEMFSDFGRIETHIYVKVNEL